jgi:4-amino-4-deoxy-L-arabinose transferase-like glycosyltransferase
MDLTLVTSYLFGKQAKWKYLFIASSILLFTLLGGRQLWTHEHRWADIVAGMFYRHDFLHPYLGQHQYYDKPLLSYWLMAAISGITGRVTTWSLRLPSAIAGLLTIWSMYRLGVQVKDRSLGLLSGWLLLTSYYFVFWARVSSADMLNLAGCLLAIVWYLEKRDHSSFPNFFHFFIFFMILALTSLCKGLAVVPVVAVIIDIILRRSWKQYINISLVLAALPACLVYLSPFLASQYFSQDAHEQNGLYLVYRENILRYFQPFDHRGSIYTYFLYLPIYILPWSLFFFAALYSLRARWASLSLSSRWVIWTLGSLFLFFTLSGSRRSYYVLPLVPFAICMSAEWILSQDKRSVYASLIIIVSFLLLLFIIDILPAWYYSHLLL